VVSIHIAGRLSGAVQSASIAADAADPARVRVVDSRKVSVGVGLVVQAAGEAILAGKDLEAVAAAAEGAAAQIRVYGAPQDLEVAVKGGRVSARTARLASWTDFRPLIVFDEQGGAHVDGARIGFARALRAMADRAVRYAAGSPIRAAIAHADGLADACYLREYLQPLLGDLDIPILEAGAVITTHVGLGAVAVAVQRSETGGGTP
jgi:DegV family protein with EDD domain